MKKWIKWPAPGQFRGEGEWVLASSIGCTDKDFAEVQETQYVPTHVGETPPDVGDIEVQ